MRLVLCTTVFFAVASAAPAIFSEERINAILDKLRKANSIGEYAVNTFFIARTLKRYTSKMPSSSAQAICLLILTKANSQYFPPFL
ncbi:hypothetical protein ANCCAN_19140 [Ancylostoma caninum]|uniref:Uncharacterized protein n=1 Tax=Ancylostoma caninum TaxID=29170 RepID=A0A368FVL2_ANCCA|nr:hypothetical protein ANCCAN_19140 [Ancylostoma caninum]